MNARDSEIEKLESEVTGLLAEKDSATGDRKRALRARIMDLRARLDPLIAARDRERVPKPGDQVIALGGVGSSFESDMGGG